jgi:hypothetical protein
VKDLRQAENETRDRLGENSALPSLPNRKTKT